MTAFAPCWQGNVVRLLVAAALAAATIPLLLPGAAQAQNFSPARFTANQPGDITIVGNTVLTCPASGDDLPIPCAEAQAGGTANNNDYSMVNVDVDPGAPGSNSSRATLSTPPGASVLFAGLYWFANSFSAARNQVSLQAPGQAGYTSITGTLHPFGTTYEGFANVTSTVAAAGDGDYTVADVKANIGSGNQGGWALVVAYGDPAQPPRNLNVYDGITRVAGATAGEITVTGFTTPPAGAVKTTLGAVVQEGDLGLSGDQMLLDTDVMSNAANPSTNNFNSSISTLGADAGGRTPNYKNQLGVDIDLFNADGLLENQATSATIKLTTSSDVYFPGVVTFATELYAPVVVPDKTVENLTHPGGPTQPGDTLRYTLSFENQGQDDAVGFEATDPIPAGASYVQDSLRITDGPPGPLNPSDAAGDDVGEFDAGQNEVRFRLGAGASATSGGTLAGSPPPGPGERVEATFDVTVDADHQEGDVIVNRGSSDYRSDTLGTPYLNQQTPETRTVVHTPDLALSKTHMPAFLAGSDTTFTLIASNVGQASSDGSQVTVTDTFPGGASGFDSITNADGVGWNCSVAGLELTCTRSDILPAGESYPPILVDARVHDPIAPTIVNTGEVSGGGDVNAANNRATDSGGAIAQADLQVSKRTTTPTIPSGGNVEWVVDVRNGGPSTAADVVLNDPLPGSDYDQVVVETSQGTCDTTVSCSLGSIVPGGTATITIRARALANDTTLTNIATGTTSTTDPDLDNNEGRAQATVLNTADVAVVKSGGPANPSTGDAYEYTLDVSNNGPGGATDLVLTDQLPTALENPAVGAPGWDCNAPGTGGLLTCTRASLANGGSSEITVSGTIAASAGGAFFENSAAVDTGSEDPIQGNNTSSKQELATPAADLAVTKFFDSNPVAGGIQRDPVDPGDTVEVQLVATNNGPSPAANATLADNFPPGFEVTAVSGSGCSEPTPNEVSCSFGTLASGASETVTVTATVTSAGGDVLENTATVDTDTGDPIQSNNRDSDRLTVTDAADVAITKVASAPTASVGDSVTYTLSASNQGPSDAANVTVTDQLPAALQDPTVNAGAGWTCNSPATGGLLTCTRAAALAPGAAPDITVSGMIGPGAAGGRLDNTAEVDTDTNDPDRTNNRSTGSVQVAPRADLAIVKTVADDTPAVDADDTFTLTVTNNGPNAAEDVTITDELPTGMTFVAAEQGCNLQDTTITCDIGDLANGGTTSRTITLRAGPALAGQARTNTAVVSTSTEDPVDPNNDAAAGITVGLRADLSITKAVTPGSIGPGNTATYTMVVSNDGPSTATGVTLTDTLPLGLDLEGSTPSQGSCSPPVGGTISCDLDSIAAGADAQVLVTVRAQTSAAGQTLDNTASVSANEPDPRDIDNTASAQLEVVPSPVQQLADLHVTKTVNRARARTGQALRYTIIVENRGNGTATNVVATDTFSAPVEVVEVTPSQGTCSSSTPIRCELGDIAAGGRVTLELTVRPRRTGRLTNSVTVTSPDDASGGDDLLGEAETRVQPGRARLTLRKRASKRQIDAGERVTFTLTLRSRGPNAALNVRVCDPLPEGLQFVSAPGARFRNGKACWRFGRLRQGAVRRLKLVARAARLPDTRRVRNVARARGAGVRARGQARVRVLAAPGRVGGVTG